ncbi:MAG: S9 family peptidase [Alphaproteobacteria bacterium]|nr:S9 family peptidase [Alphaproteobacteria bacterium]
MTVALLLTLPIASAAPAGAAPAEALPLERAVFTLDRASELAVDRTGRTAVFVRSRWEDGRDGRSSDLWAIDARGRATTRLTFGVEGLRAPVIGPGDAWVYFLADDPSGATQVHRVPLAGGTPAALTTVPGGVAAFELAREDGALWLLTHDDGHGDDAWEHLRDTWSDVHYADRTRTRSTVHRLDLSTWRLEPVWSPDRYVVELAVAPDARWVAAITAPDAALVTHEGGSDLRLYGPASHEEVTVPDAAWRAEAASPYGWLDGLAWASDGRALAVRIDFDGHPGETFVVELAGTEPVVIPLARPGEVHAVGAATWVPGTRDLCQRVVEHARVRLLCTTQIRSGRTGAQRVFPKGDVVVHDVGFSGDGRDIYAVIGTPERFPEVYRLPARGNLFPQELSDLNPQAADWALPRVKDVSWTSPDGTTVEGIVELPPSWRPEQGPLPLVVLLHGGPTGFESIGRKASLGGRGLLAGAGYAVFLPNYRGSMGYGDAFLTDLIGHENEVEVADILAGVDALVERGLADPERLAVSGWSNGGYLAAALTTHTDRFDAAIVGAGVVDLAMQWALEDTPAHVVSFLDGKLPWEAPDLVRAGSPLAAVGAVRTPTLIHHGEDDARVPLAHGQAWFRALQQLGVPSELVIYPEAGHGLRRRVHLETRLAWDRAWLDHWVRAAPEGTDAADAAHAALE